MMAEELTFWIDHLNPSVFAGVLCRKHADSLSVPRGWTLIDRREPDLHLFSLRTASPTELPPTQATPPTRAVPTVAPRPAPPPVTAPSRTEPAPAVAHAASAVAHRPSRAPRPRRGAADVGAGEQLQIDCSTNTVSASALSAPVAAMSVPAFTTDLRPPSGEDVISTEALPLPTRESVDAAPLGNEPSSLVANRSGLDELPPPSELDWLDATDASEIREDDTDASTQAATEFAPSPWMPTFDHDDDLGGMLDVTSPLLRRAFHGDDRA